MSTMVRWSPLPGLTSLQDQVNRLFEDSFKSHGTEAGLASWVPSVDIYETENELVVKTDLPGLEEKDIDVRVENNTLTIRGERKFEKNVTEDNYLRVERTYGVFARSFSLPNAVNPESIQAEYHNGVLTVQMPKREESKPKQIKIGATSNQTK